MSRIDEALRRASGQAMDEVPDDRPAAVMAPTSAEADEPVLRYVVEQPDPPVSLRVRRETIPAVAGPAARRDMAVRVPASLRGKLIVTPEMDSVSVEQYRRLAAALQELQIARGLRSLMVSSALPGEGKTLTVSNLALTLSESYRRQVLLIDADLRRPSVHDVFGLSNAVGLADALRTPDTRVRPHQVSSTLSVLPAGRIEDNPVAALSSDTLQAVITEATSRFEWVLLDTPPVGLLTDAHLVARATEGVVFVIGAGLAPYTLVQRSLAEIGDRLVGTILNRVEERAMPVRGYYQQHYATGR
jgi:protein-tyrosine kinase